MTAPPLRDMLLDPVAELLDVMGMQLGSPGTSVPPARVVEVTFSPLVRSSTYDSGRPISYDGFDNQPVDADRVYASVAYASGVLHTDADVSFTILDARVVRISFYGKCLAELSDLNTLSKLHQRFGQPDRCFRVDADGDLLSCDSFYAKSNKWVRWLAATMRPAVVIYGAGEDAIVAGVSGGLRISPVIEGSPTMTWSLH